MANYTVNVATLKPHMSEGTWAASVSSNVLTYLRSDGAATATIAYFPVNQIVPKADLGSMGGGLDKFNVIFTIADAAQ